VGSAAASAAHEAAGFGMLFTAWMTLIPDENCSTIPVALHFQM
jgi:hypothetical protein